MLFWGIYIIATEFLSQGSARNISYINNNVMKRRSIDLSVIHSIISDTRLSKNIQPISYNLYIDTNMALSTFTGNVQIQLSWNQTIQKIILHAHADLNIDEKSTTLKRLPDEEGMKKISISILRSNRMLKQSLYELYLGNLENCSKCELEINFNGYISETMNGLFKVSYIISDRNETKQYLATNMEPQNARRLFPCFDEPSFKADFQVIITRPKNYITLFNSALIKTEHLNSSFDRANYVIDYFERVKCLSTFLLGFVIIQLDKYIIDENITLKKIPKINFWAELTIHPNLRESYLKFITTYEYIQNYFNISLPLMKIDVVFLPGLTYLKPIDNMGLLIFKDTDLLQNDYYLPAHELIYQWLGYLVTPNWWNDTMVNKPLVSYLATNIVYQINGGKEFSGKYPMTILYSFYYEFSKRYPHSRITGFKQETISHKVELIFRMLNYTLGMDTFTQAIQLFLELYKSETYESRYLWNLLTQQAIRNGVMPSNYNIFEIVDSWLNKDRLPVLTVIRDYSHGTANISQKIYLRERPHDVPGGNKMLWWIPLFIVYQNNISITKPVAWLENKRRIILKDLPNNDMFIIINPEEIVPLPVNYDEKNWNLLSNYLLTEEGRLQIPSYTRAKLLHDAWNLAYAGDLNFNIALNMTLFMEYERNHIVWNPIFTFFDHIGKRISEVFTVHKKFEAYIKSLLIPLYEDISKIEDKESWLLNLRSMTSTFLCRAGYELCLNKAKITFNLWLEKQSNIGDSNEFLCTIFKWGTIDDWKYGLNTFVNFPTSGIQSNRSYLLKSLTGCPIQHEKIYQLLNISIFEDHPHKAFTDSDIFIIFNTLNRHAVGYITLLNFLSKNWTLLKERFSTNINLWNRLIASATGSFTTKQGYELVKNLYDQHRNEFGTALHIINKSLKNIKEEANWSDKNIIQIETWLDHYLSKRNIQLK